MRWLGVWRIPSRGRRVTRGVRLHAVSRVASSHLVRRRLLVRGRRHPRALRDYFVDRGSHLHLARAWARCRLIGRSTRAVGPTDVVVVRSAGVGLGRRLRARADRRGANGGLTLDDSARPDVGPRMLVLVTLGEQWSRRVPPPCGATWFLCGSGHCSLVVGGVKPSLYPPLARGVHRLPSLRRSRGCYYYYSYSRPRSTDAVDSMEH